MDVQFVTDVLTLAMYNTVNVQRGGCNTHFLLLLFLKQAISMIYKCGGIAQINVVYYKSLLASNLLH